MRSNLHTSACIRIFLFTILFLSSVSISAAIDTGWPEIRTENKPGVRWWWMGSAVDQKNLTWNLEKLSMAGIGSVEITPIYGVQGNDANEIDYLSPKWMSMLQYTQKEAKRLNMLVDMNGGTGWPFGGPNISIENAATKQYIQRYPVKVQSTGKDSKQTVTIVAQDTKQSGIAKLAALLYVAADGSREQIPLTNYRDSVLTFSPTKNGEIFALFVGKTLQQVKRAAPGGKGYVMNHLSKNALDSYLKRFDEAFSKNGVDWPHSFFNDSYEVYDADWSETFLSEFKSRRGYDLTDYLPEFSGVGEPAICARVVCDYRETISDMLLHNFTIPWTKWAHAHGSTTRNQAHGSPGNLLDLYAAMDIPECESFGFNAFDIPGLRIDERYKKSDSNPATLKYASSAAHVSGKTYTSCESMTWLTEHFRTSLSQIKPEMDQLFLNGINRIYFHGSPYTPKEAAWPGWLFYASILVNPNNTIFDDMLGLNEYATRVQSFMQLGKPDNEVLVYLPIYDIWQNYRKSNYVTFDIHKMSEKAPAFEKTIFSIRKLGYDLDYVSDAQIQSAKVEGKSILTEGGNYKLVIVPDCKFMPEETMKQLLKMAKEGATIAFLNQLPEDVPGLFQAKVRKESLQQMVSELGFLPLASNFIGKPCEKGWVMYGSSLQDMLENVPEPCTYEPITPQFGAGFIRRTHKDGYVYFVAMQQNKTIDDWVTLGVSAKSALLFNPLTGIKGKARLRQKDGKTQIYLQLKPGQSLIFKTYDKEEVLESEYPVYESVNVLSESKKVNPITLSGKWKFSFTQGVPAIAGIYTMQGNPMSWTNLPVEGSKVFAGTGRYSLRFKMPKKPADDWTIDFGTISESARVSINGQPIGIIWSLPFTAQVGAYLKPGKINTIEVDVTNLPANRISDYDKKGIKWRNFKEINFVDVLYQTTLYDQWPVMPSGLTQPVKLIPLYKKK